MRSKFQLLYRSNILSASKQPINKKLKTQESNNFYLHFEQSFHVFNLLQKSQKPLKKKVSNYKPTCMSNKGFSSFTVSCGSTSKLMICSSAVITVILILCLLQIGSLYFTWNLVTFWLFWFGLINSALLSQFSLWRRSSFFTFLRVIVYFCK